MISIILRAVIVVLIVAAIYFWYVSSDEEIISEVEQEIVTQDNDEAVERVDSPNDLLVKELSTEQEQDKQIEIPKKLSNEVPFVVQAPEGQWDNPQFQDACEEASIMMAQWWRTGGEASEGSVATKDFINMFSFEEGIFGKGVIDTSIADTAKLMKEYYSYEGEVKTDITKNHILKALASGALVIVPVDGRKLGNKYFSGEGPERHMLVITGYNLSDEEFIVNEPGTKRGEEFRYATTVLMEAIGDYKTGNKESIEERAKNMLIVRKDK